MLLLLPTTGSPPDLLNGTSTTECIGFRNIRDRVPGCFRLEPRPLRRTYHLVSLSFKATLTGDSRATHRSKYYVICDSDWRIVSGCRPREPVPSMR